MLEYVEECGNINFINSGGLTANFIYFPSSSVKVGLYSSLDMLFPVGYVTSGGATEGYISYKFDYRFDLTAGVAYYQMFTDKLGMFIEAGMGYSSPCMAKVASTMPRLLP